MSVMGGSLVTVHIAFANAGVAVLASDSQASDDTSEVHGLQKQFAGPDFLVGAMVGVQQELSAIRTGNLTQSHLDAIRDSNDVVITTSRQSLIQELQDFFVWYDGLLGRP
jgi:hypothetical protein